MQKSDFTDQFRNCKKVVYLPGNRIINSFRPAEHKFNKSWLTKLMMIAPHAVAALMNAL